MRIFKNKMFNKWAKGLLSDEALAEAAIEVAAGKVEADLGKKVYKKRIALAGTGKSGGTRNIVAYQEGNNLFFVEGFAKGKKANITPTEKVAFQKAAKVYLSLSDQDLNKAVKAKVLVEISQAASQKAEDNE